MMRNTPRAISAACALVDAAKNDLEKYGDEQKHAIQSMIETCLISLKPAIGDLWLQCVQWMKARMIIVCSWITWSIITELVKKY